MESLVKSVLHLGDDLGDSYLPESLVLEQEYGAHHRFTVVLSSEAVTKSVQEMIEVYLGTRASITLAPIEDEQYLDISIDVEPFFYGVITNIDLKRTDSGNAQFVLSGCSPTIYMDDGPHTRTFTEMGLREIVDTVLQEYQDKITFSGELPDPVIEPQFADNIEYLVQYQESNFEFLKRIAARYGEWFYYDREKMVFGEHAEEVELDLFLSEDLKQFDLGTKMPPAKFEWSAYDYKQHDFPSEQPSVSLENPLADLVMSRSEEIFDRPSYVHINRTADAATLSQMAEHRLRKITNEFVWLKGKSENPNLAPGVVVNITDRQVLTEQDYGRYIIVEVEHYIEQGGDYLNTFAAVPAEVLAPPRPRELRKPECGAQLAEVMALDDDEELGRVRVQFSWQRKEDQQTPWIRVSQMSAGAGSYHTPEVGDQVLVDFENQNPDFPFIIGTFYHGNNRSPMYDVNNYIKTLLNTKGGNVITANDVEGDSKISIHLKEEKAIINLFYDGPKIEIKAPEGQVDIDSKDINVTATGKLSLKGKNIEINADQKLDLIATDIKSEATSSFSVTNTPSIAFTATISAEVSALQVDISGSTTTSVSGGMLNLNS